MPVVINEFEIVAEPPPKPAGAEKPEPAAEGAVAWTISDIEKVVRRQAERAARLRAD